MTAYAEKSNQCIVLRFITTANRYDSITTVIPNSQLGIGPNTTFQHALLWRYIENMYWGAKRRKADMRTLEWFVLGMGTGKTILKTGHVVDQAPIPGMAVELDSFNPTPHTDPDDRAPMGDTGKANDGKYGLVIAPTLPFQVEDDVAPAVVEKAAPTAPRWTPPWQS